MDWRTAARRSLVILLLIAVPAKAQDPMQPSRVGPGTAAYRIGGGLESESLPAEIAEDLIYTAPEAFRFGPTPVSEVGLLQALLRAPGLFGDEGFRTFGWVEGGYTGASTRPGLLSVQTRQNRFGDEFLLNQLGFVLQNPLEQDDFNLGFNIRYFAGADAALGQPKGGIGSTVTNQRFSHDFRDLYLSAHLPILTEGGMDVKLGRMNTIIGYNGFLAPYRPMYSSDYQFFYSQDGAFRAATTAFDLRHQCNRQVLERIPLKCSGIHTVGYDSDIRVR